MGVPPLVCAFGVPWQVKTHGNSGFENDLKDFGMFESGLLAAFVASDWPPAIFEPDVFVVAALSAVVVWVIGSPLGLACVATLGAVLSAFGFAATLCFQKFVSEVLMERVTILQLAWETDHYDYVSEPAGAKNASYDDVPGPAGAEAVVDGVISERAASAAASVYMYAQLICFAAPAKVASDFGSSGVRVSFPQE